MFEVISKNSDGSFNVLDTYDGVVESLNLIVLQMLNSYGFEFKNTYKDNNDILQVDENVPMEEPEYDEEDSEEDELDIEDVYDEDEDEESDDLFDIFEDEEDDDPEGDDDLEDTFFDEVLDEIDEEAYAEVIPEPYLSVIQDYYQYYSKAYYDMNSDNMFLETKEWKRPELQRLQAGREWIYAGTKDLRCVCSWCTLGHPIRYECYAISEKPEGGYDKIVFGETCVADFFNISKHDLKLLQEIRKTMSDEMSLIATNLENKEANNEMIIFYNIYLAMKKVGLDVEIFGQNLTSKTTRVLQQQKTKTQWGNLNSHINKFFEMGIYIPRSMVYLAKDLIKEYCKKDTGVYDYSKFISKLYPEYAKGIMDIFVANYSVKTYAEYILDNKIAGRYAYDPIKHIGTRRDGKFNKETRFKRRRLDNSMVAAFGCNLESTSFECYTDFVAIFKNAQMLHDVHVELLEVFNVLNMGDVRDIIPELFTRKQSYTYAGVQYSYEELTEEQSKILNISLNRTEIDKLTYNYENGFDSITEFSEYFCSDEFIDKFNELEGVLQQALSKKEDVQKELEQKEEQRKAEEEAKKKAEEERLRKEQEEELARQKAIEEAKQSVATETQEESKEPTLYEQTTAMLNGQLGSIKIADCPEIFKQAQDIYQLTQADSKFKTLVAPYSFGMKIIDTLRSSTFITKKQWNYCSEVFRVYEEYTKGITIKSNNGKVKLSENKEVNDKVTRLKEYLESDNMSFQDEIGKKEPIIRGIVESVIKSGQVSDKQMTHIDIALNIAKNYKFD